MTRAAFMLLHAILALAFGIGFVLAPASVLALYGVATDPAGNGSGTPTATMVESSCS